ncbi:hypothetical protein H6G74_06315 [Nostoc spongiaeforme FACHB-130]|uniref:Uncharacterized protein n=1 Tax=Nostoc spongiaeforme FACHB-130 TaxID=1357510 RepID=A0ABR8FSA7_9NOSO|nr:hypothetical protein [Nostoc spongiaeforme]MBD2593943.1 hypothetical protein [Nostoc spongiaeforme FACHB-130]
MVDELQNSVWLHGVSPNLRKIAIVLLCGVIAPNLLLCCLAFLCGNE